MPVLPRSLAKISALTASSILLAGSIASAQTTLTSEQIFKRLDPQMSSVVLLFSALRGTPIDEMTAYDARQQFSVLDAAKIIARAGATGEHARLVGKVQDGLTIPGSDGNQIPIRIYTPAGTGPFPVVLYFHGGGFVVATIDTYDQSARNLCDDTNAIVVSVEYRKAPEAPYPAALHDAISSYKWVTSTIQQYGGIAKKVAVAGESAGGNLATEVALAARNQGLQMPTHQLLIYPVTSSDTNRNSDVRFESPVLPLDTSLLQYFLRNYVASPSQANDPGASPILANLKGLPGTTIIAAQFDPLVGEGVAYRNALWAAGDAAYYRVYPKVTHEFFGMGDVVDTARQAELFAAQQLIQSFQ